MTLNNIVVPNRSVTAGKPMTQSTILGNLVFTSIGELKVDKQVLETLFSQEGLSLKKYQPGEIRASDAMRRTTSLLKNKKVPISFNGANKTAVIDLTESATADYTVRYIGRKVVDDQGQKVQFDQISTFLFDKKLNTLTYITPDPIFLTEFPYVKMLEDIIDVYAEWCQFHTKDTVRNIINKVVNSLMPTPIKPNQDDDSVARFIPITYSSELNSMKSVINGLKPYHVNSGSSGCQFIELFDSQTNRSLLEDSVKIDIKSRMTTLITDLSYTLQAKGSISVEKGKSLVTQLISMREEAKHYSQLLGASMSVLESQIATALNRVEQAPVDASKKKQGAI